MRREARYAEGVEHMDVLTEAKFFSGSVAAADCCDPRVLALRIDDQDRAADIEQVRDDTETPLPARLPATVIK